MNRGWRYRKKEKEETARRCARVAPYWRGKAECKFSGCTKYVLIIHKGPKKNNWGVTVSVQVQGSIHHPQGEHRRRHSKYQEQEVLKSELCESSPMHGHFSIMEWTQGKIL